MAARTQPAHLPASTPVVECGEPLVDLRRVGGIAFGPPPECPETEPYYTLVRRTVYEKLLRVQDRLPNGWCLRLYEGLRSLQVQQAMFDQEQQRVRARQPDLSPEDTHASACRLVSPVTHWDGNPNVPFHATGGAVDVELLDANGVLVEMGMAIRDWATVLPDWCLPRCPGLPKVVQGHRDLLAVSMAQEGFMPYAHEWWHFSYGDTYWACYSGRQAAIYGPCTSEMVAQASGGS